MARALFACSDHPLHPVTPGVSAERLRVKSITHLIGLPDNQQKVSLFSYDNQGRLSSIIAYLLPDSSQGPVERNTYQYDAQNRLIQHQRIITRPAFYRGTIEQHLISYNSAGQITEIRYFNDNDTPGTPILTFTATPQFSSSNKLQSYQKLLSPTFLRDPFSDIRLRGDLLLSNITFTGDNLTAYHIQTINNDIGSSISIGDSDQRLTYDKKINPFYGFYIIPEPTGNINNIREVGTFNRSYYGGLDNLTNLSRNNVLSEETSNAPSLTTYEYTYNAANLPITRTVNRTNDVQKIAFEYESY
jgi:hypothetical protein